MRMIGRLVDLGARDKGVENWERKERKSFRGEKLEERRAPLHPTMGPAE